MRFKLYGQGHGWQAVVYPAADEAEVFYEVEAKLGRIAITRSSGSPKGGQNTPSPATGAAPSRHPRRRAR